jgi:predicted 2-oxoglutarate/Fe(II)-dependent dioxygenase YbiX
MELKDYIRIYDEVIPVTTVANLIKFANEVTFEAGQINVGEINKKIRSTHVKNISNLSNSMTEVHWHNYLLYIFERGLTLYEKEFNHLDGSISSRILNIDILKYNQFDKYTWHADHHANVPRTLSCILLLNNDYEGGNLTFREPKGENEFSIENRPGRLIIWPSCFLYPHCVKPVLKGTRYSVVSWTI